MAVMYLVRRFVVLPLLDKRSARKAADDKKAAQSRVEERKREAQQHVRLMRETVLRKIQGAGSC